MAVSIAAALAACATPLDGGGGDDSPEPDPGPPDVGVETCDPAVNVPLDAPRPAEMLPAARLALVASRMPRVACGWLKDVLESPDTMFYDRTSIVPGYQDSFGDNVVTPIGMRPNTIDRGLIDTAVPGGHAQIFVERGLFHFPFGRPIANQGDNAIVNFLHLPRAGGELAPVVWWRRDPNSYTHRYEWMFPKGTVLGELLFVVRGDGTMFPFEIRARVRELDHWRNEVVRPFPTAAALAAALERKRAERPAWEAADDVAALIAHLRDPSTLEPAQLRATHFAGSFPAIDGAADALPGIADPELVGQLLLETPFVTAREQVWKQSGSLIAYAATTSAGFHVVPRGYDGGFLRVDDQTCARCHEHAGRPFRDYYDNILAYGELWGMDDSFTWHPFRNDRFVDAAGNVKNFNHDNRELRADFVAGGVLAPYAPADHPADLYRKLPGAWKDFSY